MRGDASDEALVRRARYVITQQMADQERLDHLAERFERASYGQEDIP